VEHGVAHSAEKLKRKIDGVSERGFTWKNYDLIGM